MRNAIIAAGVVLAGVSANLGVVNGPSASADRPAVVKPSSMRAGHPKLPWDHPLSILYDYKDPNGPPPPGSHSAQELTGNIQLSLNNPAARLIESKVRIPIETFDTEDCPRPAFFTNFSKDNEFLIATVPDPTGTHLALTFDRQIEAIMMAAQDSSWDFDRYWLPWRMDPEPDTADPDVRAKSMREKLAREQLPGLLIFRRPYSTKHSAQMSRKTLLVFLVSETPTSGINRHQFYRAGCYADRLRPAGSHKPLRILGPTFSGSFESLEQGVREIAPFSPNTDVQYLSGSASSPASIATFRTRQGFQEQQQVATATVHTDQELCEAFMSAYPDWRPLAILREGSTAYGRQATDYCPGMATIAYPREISRLRNAYQDDPKLTASSKTADAQVARHQLEVPLRDSQPARDTIPQFSAEQTPATQESALFQISEMLRRERYRALIVSGSNPLDLLFLSRFFREACPDLRVVIFDADLLFVHGTDSADFYGILSVSTYPLAPETLQWSGVPLDAIHVRRIFASNAQEGHYNAALFLLGKKVNPRDYSAPFLDYTDRPPVWVSVVGRGAYWPVAPLRSCPGNLKTCPDTLVARDTSPFDPVANRGSNTFNAGIPSRVWNMVFLSCSGLAAGFIAIWIYATRRTPLHRWCADFHPTPEKSLATGGVDPPARAYYHALTLFFILASYVTLAYAPMFLGFSHAAPQWVLSATTAAAVSGALLLAVCIACRKSKARWITLAIPSLAIIVILAIWGMRWSFGRLFHSIRSVHMQSGVAPNVPLFLGLVALAWWSWVNLERIIFAAERDPGVPGLAYLTKRLQDLLRAPVLPGGSSEIVPILVVLAITGVASRWIRTIESEFYTRLFVALLALLGSLLVGCAWGYFLNWRRLRLFLEALELHPVRHAFSALPPMSQWSPLWQHNARKRNYTVPHRFRETVEKLFRQDPAYYTNLGLDVKDLKTHLDLIVELAGKGEREPSSLFDKFNAKANSVGAQLETKLIAGSWSEGSSDTLEKLKEKHGEGNRSVGNLIFSAPPAAALSIQSDPAALLPASQPDLLAAEAVALRYIAFIRYVMLQLQNQLSFLTGGFILTAIAINSYPFQGGNFLRWWVTAIFGVLSTLVIIVFAEMERDATLSRLMDTKAGKLESTFYLRLLTAGALPLVTVMASHFPGLGRFLFSWVQPALSALH